MDVRLVLASLLFLSVTATAQGEAKPAAPATPDAAAGKPATPAAQDPDKTSANKPADVLQQLTREKERLESEIEYAKNRAKNANAMLAQKLGKRGQTFKAIDAGTSVAAAPAAVAPAKKARLMEAKEVEGQPADVMLLVGNQPIKQGQFDELMAYLATSPVAGDEASRAQRVLFDLVRTASVVGAFPENGALGQVGDLLGQLQSGKPIAELIKAVGSVQGAKEDGSVEITRNSYLGTKVEQVAFTLKAGEPSRPFATPQGLLILQVDSLEKGASPELDKVKAKALLVPWQADPAALQKAQVAAMQGQVDLVVRNQQVLDMLPAMWKNAPAPVQFAGDTLDNEIAAMKDTMVQLQQAIDKAKADGTPEGQQKAEALQKQLEQVQKAVEEMQRKQVPGEVHDADKKTGEAAEAFDQAPAKALPVKPPVKQEPVKK
jgi:hypothetical protein